MKRMHVIWLAPKGGTPNRGSFDAATYQRIGNRTVFYDDRGDEVRTIPNVLRVVESESGD